MYFFLSTYSVLSGHHFEKATPLNYYNKTKCVLFAHKYFLVSYFLLFVCIIPFQERSKALFHYT